MAAAVFMILFWLGFERFDWRKAEVSITKREFNNMLKRERYHRRLDGRRI